MHAPGLLLATALLGGGVVLVASRLVGFVHGMLRPRLDRLAPEDRAQVLGFLAVAPWLLAVTILLLTYLPSFVTIPGWIEDHCHPHEHHPHLCLTHGLWMPSGPLWVGVGTLALVGLGLWGRLVIQVLRSRRTLWALMRLARAGEGYRVLPGERPLAFSAGLWRPATVLSEGVIKHLDSADLQVVLAHEAAHAQRRDALWRVILEALALGLSTRARGRLMEDYVLACEEACDRRAMAGGVSADRVAEVLLRMQRLGCQPLGDAPAATGSHLDRRVRALLGASYPGRPWWMKALWALPLVLLATEPVHHGAETLLGLFLS